MCVCVSRKCRRKKLMKQIKTEWHIEIFVSHNWKQHLLRSVYFHFPCVRVKRKKKFKICFASSIVNWWICARPRCRWCCCQLMALSSYVYHFCFSFDCFDWTAPRKSTVLRGVCFYQSNFVAVKHFWLHFERNFLSLLPFCIYMYVFNLWFLITNRRDSLG